MANITLGNFFNTGGRNVISGLSGSGLDSKGLIDSLVEAKSIPKVKLEDKITLNDEKVSAFGELKTLLGTFKDAVNFMRNPPGVANEADNIFEYRNATLSSNTSVLATSYLSVNSEPGASIQNYSITDITSIARAKKQTSNTFIIANADTSIVTDAATPGFFKAGVVTVNGETITFAENDSLNTVVSKFNAVSADTGISASVLQVSAGNYKIVFSANETGTVNDFDLDNAGVTSVVDPQSVLSSLTFADAQAASNASFVIDDVTITRSTNSISDVVDGLTFNLIQQTPAPLGSTTITIDVAADESIAKNGVINFINAFNELRVFLAKQSEVSPDGGYVETAVLASDPVLRNVLNTIGNELSGVVAGIATDGYDSLSDIGITFTDLPESEDTPFTRNILTVDEDKLENAIASNFGDVQALFGFTYTTSNANFRIFSRTNDLNTNSFTINVNPGADTFTATIGATTVDLVVKELTSGGYRLTGPDGSAIEGLTMLYASSATATISVTATQGIADRLFNFVEETLKDSTGTLSSQVDTIESSTTRFKDEITKFDRQIEQYRERLISQFSSLESILSSINSLLTSLDAQSQARNNSSG